MLTATWAERAALLDPRAYVLLAGTTFSQTVPAGETWWAVDLWHVKAGTNFLFLRQKDALTPMMLPAGTVIEANGTQTAQAYICKPSLVASDVRYTTDPRGLFNERLRRLRTLPLNHMTATLAAGSARGSGASASFALDFEWGLITRVAAHDVSWTILNGPNGPMNTNDEVSDDHQIRFARATFIPFRRNPGDAGQGFYTAEIRAASVSGNTTDTSLAGSGSVTYVKLPSDW